MKLILVFLLVFIFFFIFSKKKKPSESIAPSESLDDYVVYSIKVDGVKPHEKEIIDKLLIVSDLYECSKSEIIDAGHVNEDIPMYEAKKRPVEFVSGSDDGSSIKVVIDGVYVGDVPEKNLSRVRNMLKKNDPDISWSLWSCPIKCISSHYDYDKEKDVYDMDKVHFDIGIKVSFKYRKVSK